MANQHYLPIAILGAGSWGTALALYLARRGQEVRIWSIETAEITAMLADGESKRYQPGHRLPSCLHAVADLATAVADVNDVIMVVPSAGFRSTLFAVKPHLAANARIICATKGLDTEHGLLLSEVAAAVTGDAHPFAVLSGPSFAREVAAGLPTAVVIASKQKSLVTDLSQRFTSDIFHVTPSEDVIGVELGGVVKNVIAIATGLSDGMQYGTNMRSAIITRGLAEIIRLGKALGGKEETFLGLSGLGDLILTCSDDQSRNRRLGLLLGKGLTLDQAIKEIGQVAEGKRNAELVVALAKKHQVAMPICEIICRLLHGEIAAKEAMQALLRG